MFLSGYIAGFLRWISSSGYAGWTSSLGLHSGDDRDEALVATTTLEADGDVNKGIQRVIAAHTHVGTRMMDGATLADDDVTRLAGLSTPNLHAETLARRLTAVLRTTYTFLMCHTL